MKVWVGEIEAHARAALNFLVTVELGSVISGDSLEAAGVFVDEPVGALVEFVLGTIRQLADQGVAGLAFHDGHDAILASGTHDGVDLPMPGLLAFIHDRRALVDMAFAGQAAPTVVTAIALAPLLGGATQVPIQASTATFIAPDVLIDRLVTDG